MVEEEVVEVVVEGVFLDMDEKFKIGEFSHFGQNATSGISPYNLTNLKHVLNQLIHEG